MSILVFHPATAAHPNFFFQLYSQKRMFLNVFSHISKDIICSCFYAQRNPGILEEIWEF